MATAQLGAVLRQIRRLAADDPGPAPITRRVRTPQFERLFRIASALILRAGQTTTAFRLAGALSKPSGWIWAD